LARDWGDGCRGWLRRLRRLSGSRSSGEQAYGRQPPTRGTAPHERDQITFSVKDQDGKRALKQDSFRGVTMHNTL
jgi:hypothetical protein